MEIELVKSEGFEQLNEFSSDGFYIDRDNNLYLHHLYGVSLISQKGGTNSGPYRNFTKEVRKLEIGDILTIKF